MPVNRELELVQMIFGEDRDLVILFGDPPRARELLGPIFHPDAEFEFMGVADLDDAMGVTGTRHGLDALLEAWTDWLEPFSSYRVEGRGFFPIDGGVLTLTRAFTRTRTGNVELEQDQAAVWRFRQGKVRRWEAWLYADDAKAAFGV